MTTPSPATNDFTPPWMTAEVLARHLSVKKSTIRTLMKHHGLPRPRQIGNIALWNWELVNRWLLRGDGSDTKPEQVTDDVLAKRAKDIRKSMRRLHLVPEVSGPPRCVDDEAAMDKEMMKALEADGEKLRQLTGEDHGPRFIYSPAECPHCAYDRQFPGFEGGGWIQQENNGPIVSCPTCNADGSWRRS